MGPLGGCLQVTSSWSAPLSTAPLSVNFHGLKIGHCKFVGGGVCLVLWLLLLRSFLGQVLLGVAFGLVCFIVSMFLVSLYHDFVFVLLVSCFIFAVFS